MTENLPKVEALFVEISVILQKELAVLPHGNEVDKAFEMSSLQRESDSIGHYDAVQPEGGIGTDLTIAAAPSNPPILPSRPSMDNAASEVLTQPKQLPEVSASLIARYDREQLYEKVWTLPMLQVAIGYGVSDVAIGKTCRKLYIPVPGRGYWAKKAANRLVEPRPPLPQLPAQT